MTKLYTRVLSWAPRRKDGDNVEPATSSSPGQKFPFNDPTYITFRCRDANRMQADAVSSPESSSSSFLADPNGSDPEVVVRKGDPNWVARPCNPFLLFRREFVKNNQRPKGAPGATGKPSLSKRAGEAWKALPAEERKHWEALAAIEKEEHSRMHPDYRFRPKKRVSHSRPRRMGDDPSDREPESGPRRVMKSSSVPGRSSMKASSPLRDTVASPSSPSPNALRALRAKKRRSVSVPVNPDTPSSPTSDSSAPASFLSRSYTQDYFMVPSQSALSPSPSFSSISSYFDFSGSPPYSESTPQSEFYTPALSPDGSTVSTTPYVSPLSVVASSLANWNGEYPSSTTTLSSPASSWYTPQSYDPPAFAPINPADVAMSQDDYSDPSDPVGPSWDDAASVAAFQEQYYSLGQHFRVSEEEQARDVALQEYEMGVSAMGLGSYDVQATL